MELTLHHDAGTRRCWFLTEPKRSKGSSDYKVKCVSHWDIATTYGCLQSLGHTRVVLLEPFVLNGSPWTALNMITKSDKVKIIIADNLACHTFHMLLSRFSRKIASVWRPFQPSRFIIMQSLNVSVFASIKRKPRKILDNCRKTSRTKGIRSSFRCCSADFGMKSTLQLPEIEIFY